MNLPLLAGGNREQSLFRRRRLPISSHVVPALLLAADSAAILLSALLSHAIIVGDQPSTASYYVVASAFVWITTLVMMSFARLYLFEPIVRPLSYADKIVVSFATTFLFLLAAAFSLKISATFSRFWIGVFFLAACAGTLGGRVLIAVLLRRLSGLPAFCRKVIVAGEGAQLANLLDYLQRLRPAFIQVEGIFADELWAPNTTKFVRLGSLDDLNEYARMYAIDDIIVALPWSDDRRVLSVFDRLRELPANVYLASDVLGFHVAFRAPPSHFGGLPIFELSDNPLSGWNGLIKGVEDYVLGAVIAIISFPLMLLVAVAIKLESKGPVLFRQTRLGLLNRPFQIYKFRTMKDDEAREGTLQATRNDPRVTRVGWVLRRTSLDELPNLLNVFNGTMSLVGPRPHALDHNQAYSKTVTDYFVRHRVKPGMTGWAQVNGLRGETDTLDKMEARVQYDIVYAENWSLWFDIKILVMTLVIWVTGRNAY